MPNTPGGGKNPPSAPPSHKDVAQGLRQKAQTKTRDRLLHVDDLRWLRQSIADSDLRRQALIEYYSNTPEGRQEFSNSPHNLRTVEEVVDDLCKEIDSWEDDGLPKSWPGRGGAKT